MAALNGYPCIVEERVVVSKGLNLDGPIVFGAQSIPFCGLLEMVYGGAAISDRVEAVCDWCCSPRHYHSSAKPHLRDRFEFNPGLQVACASEAAFVY